MASEIAVTAGFILTNSGLRIVAGGERIIYDQSVIGGGSPGYVVVGTSEEDVSLSDLTDPGYCFLKNLDATNFVLFGKKDGSGNMQAIGKIRPGGVAVLELAAGATLRMQADTAACKVQIIAIER